MSDLEIKVAYSFAVGATDEEELHKVRYTAWKLHNGKASLAESRGLLATVDFLLEYIDREEEKWAAKTAVAVEMSEKRLTECTRKLKKTREAV